MYRGRKRRVKTPIIYNTGYAVSPVDNFRELSQRDISKIARLPNEWPRKTLDFRTPYEVFSELH
jgi:hypothetical protein